jgi:UDP-GlcNAc:undecaprenyl-phosphate GlcNAc-1-phosphate transferase
MLATPLVKKLANKIGAVDVPKDERRMHKTTMPLLGGLAFIFAFSVTLILNIIANKYGLFSNLNNFKNFDSIKFTGLFLGIFILVVGGILDDKYKTTAKIKLVFQFAAAFAVVFSGIRISSFTNPFSPQSPIIVLPDWLAIVVSILWIVVITNAINLLDGLDGLAAGICAIAALSLFIVSFLNGGGPEIALLTAILAGAAIGFLPYNFNPAKIFMGEAGSSFLGFILAIISINGALKVYAAFSISIPLIVLAIPILDTSWAFLRRTFSGKSFAVADRGHLHHRLVDIGLTQRQTVLFLYAVTAALGLFAIVLSDQTPISMIVLVISVSILIVIFSKLASMVSANNKRKGDFLDMNEHAVKQIVKKEDTSVPLKVMTIFGTRPDAIKMIPVAKELAERENVTSIVCVTGQHREMLDQVLDIFNIKPEYDLDIMKDRQTLQYITTSIIEKLTEVLEKEMPDIVLVHGDTTTCFASSLSAFYLQIPVGHVEAGLRTFDKYSPFPEEMNRKLTGAISELHFSPTITNKSNLINEGVPEESVYITGNTVIDTLKLTVTDDYKFKTPELQYIDFDKYRVITVEAHRRENLGEPLKDICRAICTIIEKYPDTFVVYPVHLNPAVQDTVNEYLCKNERIKLIEPVDVKELHNLMSRSYMIMTDSGGLQEEAPSLGKPILVLRNETERPEAVTAGTVKLIGVEYNHIVESASLLLSSQHEYDKMKKAVNPYGDGMASKRIADALLYEFGYTDITPADFIPKIS